MCSPRTSRRIRAERASGSTSAGESSPNRWLGAGWRRARDRSRPRLSGAPTRRTLRAVRTRCVLRRRDLGPEAWPRNSGCRFWRPQSSAAVASSGSSFESSPRATATSHPCTTMSAICWPSRHSAAPPGSFRSTAPSPRHEQPVRPPVVLGGVLLDHLSGEIEPGLASDRRVTCSRSTTIVIGERAHVPVPARRSERRVFGPDARHDLARLIQRASERRDSGSPPWSRGTLFVVSGRGSRTSSGLRRSSARTGS